MVIERLFGDKASPQNLSAMAAAVGCTSATLGSYKKDREKLKRGSARTIARMAKIRRFSDEEKARLIDELAE